MKKLLKLNEDFSPLVLILFLALALSVDLPSYIQYTLFLLALFSIVLSGINYYNQRKKS
tara:strand:- start:536 stop:712 length:177 start_codon:yes stop_codon:yes gene_type:complete